MNRQRCISVVLLLVLSHAVVGAHVATHSQTDLAECELCAAYADPSDAVLPQEIALPTVETYLQPLEHQNPTEALLASLGAQPRGPPLAI